MQPRDFNGLRVQIRAAGSTSMAVQRADDEFGAAMAGRAPYNGRDSLGRDRRTPKFVLNLINCFCHKGALLRFFSDRKRITKGSYYKDDSYELIQGKMTGSQSKNYATNTRISHFAPADSTMNVAVLVPAALEQGFWSKHSGLGTALVQIGDTNPPQHRLCLNESSRPVPIG
jgi:hypothetical protein